MKMISADYVLTMNADKQCIQNAAIVIDGAKIHAIGTIQQLEQQFPELKRQHFSNQLLMPGLINTHCHSGLLRGTAEGLAVWDWLQQYIDPMHRVLTAHDAKVASYLCYAEALLSGTTTIVDMWRYMDGSAEAAEKLGIRSILVPYVAEHPDHNYFETLKGNNSSSKNGIKQRQGAFKCGLGLSIYFMQKKKH